MNINFAGGLVTNEVYNPRSRGVSGQYVRNCRVNGNGWLIPRKGRVRAEAPDVFSYENEYGGSPLAKIAPGSVRYSESGAADVPAFSPVNMVFQAVKVDTSQIEQAFPTQQGDTGEPPPQLSPKTVIGEKSDPITVEPIRVVRAEDQFGEYEVDPANRENTYRARVHDLKIIHINDEQIAIRFRIIGDINLKVGIVDYGSKQVVRHVRDTTYLDGGSQDEEPDQTGDNTGPRRKQVIWDGKNDFGEFVAPGAYSVAFEEAVPQRRLDADGDYLPVESYEYRRSFLPFDITWEVLEIAVGNVPDATHVDIFLTEDTVSERYFWVARLPVDSTVHYHFPVLDVNTEGPLTFETPDWEYIAANEYRAYVAELESNRVYLSHFNPGTGERLYQNFTNFIDLDLQDGHITGLHFLRDTHLIVYASNQIQILATDPIAELHSVIDFITPRDDKGQYIGCISPESIVDMGGVHYFLATDKRIYRYDGSNLREMSDKVHGVLSRLLHLENAVGFSHDQHYLLSVQLDSDNDPDTTLVYDLIHGVWWQDDFGVSDAMKDRQGNAYGVIDGQTFQLYTGDTDDGEPIRRVWRSHPYYGRIQQKWESVHVSPQAPAVIDVEVFTEFNRAEGSLDIESLANPWTHRMGCNLRGRTLTIEIQTESTAAIDRIAVNERVRNAR
ncbi:MAG: hypothetical protein OXH00_02650 [Candidatus Poribacteria bacterium]|nr:hypothetical protein [Candidatus Poribacteria bacterium]